MKEKIKQAVEDIVEENNTAIQNIVSKAVEGIVETPVHQDMTIAELIEYDPMEMIDPVTQGLIFRDIKEVCQELGITLEEKTDQIGGLMFYLPFHKK